MKELGRSLVDGLINTWFDIRQQPRDPTEWNATAQLDREMALASGKDPEKEKASAEHAKRAAAKSAKRVAKMFARQLLVDDDDTDFDAASGTTF